MAKKTKEFADFVIEHYNEIFKNLKDSVEDNSTWYHQYYGSYGAQSIVFKDDVFNITIIVHSASKDISISMSEMLERVYLYDRFKLEGYFSFSFNSNKLHDDMKVSPCTDGFFLVLTPENIPALNKEINDSFEMEYGWEVDFTNKQIERNKSLPEPPTMDGSLEDFMIAFNENEKNSDKYKSEVRTPVRQKDIDLNDYLLLETYT